LKIAQGKTGGVVIECLLSNHEALSTIKKKKRRRRKEETEKKEKPSHILRLSLISEENLTVTNMSTYFKRQRC
jgi:hypothetical protein